MHRLDLAVVGTGIRTVGHLTVEAISYIKTSDKVLYVVSDPVAEALIHELNADGAESLYPFYAPGKPRIQTYHEMVGRTMELLREGKRVCMAAYGHPGVFAFPTHESVRQARAAGFRARMLPGISAEDCLFADLGVDPAMNGCQSFEATDFLLNGRILDPTGNVVLWQIGVLGDTTYKAAAYDMKGMPELLAKLYRYYDPAHPVAVYEAPLFPGVEPVIRWIPLHQLPWSGVSAVSTLYVPPGRQTAPDAHLYQALGFPYG